MYYELLIGILIIQMIGNFQEAFNNAIKTLKKTGEKHPELTPNDLDCVLIYGKFIIKRDSTLLNISEVLRLNVIDCEKDEIKGLTGINQIYFRHMICYTFC